MPEAMNAIMECFDLVQVVSLRDRLDRRREMTEQLNDMRLPLTPGKVEFFDAIRPDEAGGFPSRSVRGCFLSHLNAIKLAQSRGVERLLMLEDDLEVLPDDAERLHRLAPAIADAPWDMLYLGHRVPVEVGPELALVPWREGIATTHMYAVRNTAFAPIIAYLEGCLTRPAGDPIGGPMHVDGAFSMFRAAHPEHPTLVASPSLGGQRSSRSDIHTSRIDSVPGLREFAGLARRLRRGWKSHRAA